uniref:Oligo-1,6-glucosidase 1 n=1 Tax=Bacillus cereus HuA4-10 TaxID=1053206 RepID=J8CYG6_BACCE|nr:oligo-1,6-glucosidase 1 [Bacillus cereus HuA4-10]
MKTVANSPYFVMIVLRKRLHKKRDAKGESYYEENMVERSSCLSNLST